MSTSTTSASTGFSGQSSYASDLQNVITRSVALAQLPITQLQNLQSSLTNQQGELQTLGQDFQSIQLAVDSINSSTGPNSYSATVDNSSATATLSSGALLGTYSLSVSSVGSQTNTISAATATAVADPSSSNISSSSTFTLNVNGTDYTITPSSDTLDSLVQSINSSGAKVQATVVNVGGSVSPDYRLSIQSSDYAPDTIQLNDGASNLLTTLSTGSYVSYQVNGQPSTPIDSTSRSLAISPGLTVHVNQTGTVNVTVAQSASSLSSALGTFVTAYNAAVDELQKNRGQNGGALTGQSIVATLESSLQSLSGYSSSSGTVQSIADLGLTFDQNGHLSLDQGVLSSAAATSLSDVANFLGSETSGGFLQAAYSTLTSLTDSTSGSISQVSQSIGTSITNLTTEISTKQDQVTQLQNNLNAQMAAADSAISSLESQVTEITNLFAAETQASKNITG